MDHSAAAAPTLQPRPSSSSSSSSAAAYFPPHRTQLHPRMIHIPTAPTQTKPSKTHPHPLFRHKCLLLLASLLTLPFLFYLFSTAHKIHSSSKFATLSKPRLFSVVLDMGPHRSQVRVFEVLGEGKFDFADAQLPLVVGSAKLRKGFLGDVGDPGSVVEELVEFAKGWVPNREWVNTVVQLLVMGDGGGEMGRVLKGCRRVLRHSVFVFKDPWARAIGEEEKGVYAWVAVNYALGNLGLEPQKTTGIVELGGSSLQVTFASREVAKVESSQIIKLDEVTYYLQTQSLLKFGQDAVWELLHKKHNSRQLMSSSSHRDIFAGNPCIPKGFEAASNVSDGKLVLSHPAGNFTACRVEALALLNSRQEECLHPPCEMFSLYLDLKGKPVSQENLLYASEFFGLFPRASLFELEGAGQHYCEDDWHKLKSEHHGVDDWDLLRYCFSSAYMVALLHDSLGIAMDDRRYCSPTFRQPFLFGNLDIDWSALHHLLVHAATLLFWIGFANHNGSTPLDWTLGAFVLQSMVEPHDSETENKDVIVGNESVTYFSLFAFLLIALLAGFFLLQWRKPQLKTIYDLEKGHYIVTRVPR